MFLSVFFFNILSIVTISLFIACWWIMEKCCLPIPIFNQMLKVSRFSTKSIIETDLTMLCRFDKKIFSLCSFLLAAKRKENEAGISPALVLNGLKLSFKTHLCLFFL